jgi:hypothetical protein
MYTVITAFLNFRTSLSSWIRFPVSKDDEKLRVWKGISQALEIVKSSEVSVFFGGSNLDLTRTWSKIILTYYALWWLLYDLSRYCIEEKIWREHAPLLNMSSVVSNCSQPRWTHETMVIDDLVWMILFPKFDYPKKVANYISSIDRLGWFIVYIVACSVNSSVFSTPEKSQNYKERFNRSCTKVILINLCAKRLDSLIDIFDLIRHI